ncbi:hypothetical protein GCM10025876_14630 [Demequina litorisediminis]|uniref:Uncharacterized protein n=1 Tax=Demequina litorisediminis TaxID=1849022 RepID=A0ABQ6IBS7_9MICO|nr:hypothetical protein GCM10025876_14630 [Demequina litorisediminis]
MRLNDALRGAADQAPIDGVTVSTADARRRVSRRRALRLGSNGLVGAGAVAILGVGALSPVFAASGAYDSLEPAMASGGAREELGSMADSGGDMAGSAEGFAADGMLASPWACGSEFSADDPAWAYGDTSGVTFEVGEAVASDGAYEIERNLTANRPVDLLTGGDYVITWNGIIVGSYLEADPLVYGPADEPSLPEGAVYERLDPATDFSSLQSWQIVEPVNCWDGTALPAGDYEVHLAQTLAYPGDADGDVPASTPTPSDVATDVPSEDSSTTDNADAGAHAGMDAEIFRVAAEPVTFTVDGEPVDDPFGAYLGGTEPEPLPEPTTSASPGEPEPLPSETTEPSLPEPQKPLTDGALTPDIAQQLFESSAVDGGWDMAAGSHRWLMSNATGQAYWGCAWDDTDAKFPGRSLHHGSARP